MSAKGEICDKVKRSILESENKISRFYHMLKTHKFDPDKLVTVQDVLNWVEENGWKVRAIISGSGSPTEKASEFVDHFLNPGMPSLDSYMRDTKECINLVEKWNEKWNIKF